ncbi:MAG: plasmid pRiA4b ORF-3 family protein [Chitinophagales bacterium]
MKKFYQLKIQVKRIRPSIYRTIIVPENITFLKLHSYIQTLFGLEDYHLWQFNKGGHFDSTIISLDADEDDFLDFYDKKLKAKETKINEMLLDVKDKLEYWYDFGDDWLMNVEIQKIFSKNELPKKADKIPFVLKAKGPMLLEDVGGTYMFPDCIRLFDYLKSNIELTTKEINSWEETIFRIIGDNSEGEDWKKLYIAIFSDLYKTDWNNFVLE